MYCRNCGTFNNKGNLNCIRCGQHLQTQNSANNFQQINNVQTNNDSIRSKSGGVPKIAILILSIIVCLGLSIFFINKNFNKSDKMVFFLKNENGNYALFNYDGKRLTDFIYTSVSEFENNAAKVRTDKQVGIISSSGKMLVPFDDYDDIYKISTGLYETSNDNGRYLINETGKVLYNISESKLTTYTDIHNLFLITMSNKYIYLNENGKKIIEIPIVKDTDKPTISVKDDFVSIFYNAKNYIINIESAKEIAVINSDILFCINGAKEDGSIITLNSCGKNSETQEKKLYKIIKNGKTYDWTPNEDNLNCVPVYSNSLLKCRNSFLDSDLKFQHVTTTSGFAYIDDSNYAYNKNNGVSVYKNFKLVKELENMLVDFYDEGYRTNGIYILYNKNSRRRELYDVDGNQIGNSSYKNIGRPDINGLMEVKDDNQGYYLLDSKGNKVSDIYDKIKNWYGYYIVTRNDLLGIIDKTGKIIVDCKYSDIVISRGIATLKTEETNILYNLETRKVIIKSVKYAKIEEYYIKVDNDGKTQYYTYDGKLFYEL